MHIMFISFIVSLLAWFSKEALIAFTALMMVLANIFVLKQTILFGLQATSADALAVGSFLGFNLLQEWYGSSISRTTIAITFILLFTYAVLTQFHLLYQPSLIDQTHYHFTMLLSSAPWLVGGSILIWTLSQIIDYMLFGMLKTLCNHRFFTLRNYIAVGLSQMVDTFLFTLYLQWLGVIKQVAPVFIISFAIKFIITLIASPLVSFFVKHFRMTER